MTRAWQRPLIALLIGCVAVYYLAFGFFYGQIMTTDGVRDPAYARYLTEVGFNPLPYLSGAEIETGINHTVNLAPYILYTFLLAGLEQLLGLIVVDAATYAAAAARTVWLLGYVSVGVFGRVVALAFWVLAFDGYQWTAMSQSDSLQVALALLTLAIAVRACVDSGTSRSRWLWAGTILLLAVGMFLRPTWPPQFAFLAAFAWPSWKLRAGGGEASLPHGGGLVLTAVAAGTRPWFPADCSPKPSNNSGRSSRRGWSCCRGRRPTSKIPTRIGDSCEPACDGSCSSSSARATATARPTAP